MQSYISHRRGTVFYHLINYLSLKTCPCKNIGNYRKYDIFFNFRFTGNMIFPSIAENQENMIFTLSVFTKMLFFMQWKMVFVQFYKVIKDRHLVMGGSKHYKLLPGTSFDNCFQKLLLSSLLLYCYFCVLVVKLI